LKNHSHSVFQTAEWTEVLTDDNWQPIYLINDDWSGAMVLMENKEKNAYESSLYGCYGGHIGNPVNIYELLSTDLNYIRIVDYFNTFQENWNKKEISTYLLDTNDYKLSHGRKDDLRKAKLLGLKIRETTDMEEFTALYLEAMKQFKTENFKSKEFFDKILKSGLAKFYIAELDKPVAISVHLFYNGEIFNYITMSLNRQVDSLTSITKHIIDNNSEYKLYNFGVSINEGNSYYKKSWGAKEYKYSIQGLIFKLKYEYV
jgi:hypothetical protein